MSRFAASLLLILSFTGPVSAETEYPMELWRTETFRRRFMGSYGMNADVEPSVTVLERELMEKVMALMGEDDGLHRAQRLLRQQRDAERNALFDFTLGNIHFQKDELDQAAAAYRNAVLKFPSYQRAHKNLGLVLVRTGAFDEAVEPLTRALELGAHDGLTFGLCGYAHLMNGEFTSAETAYRQAIMLQPDTDDWKLGLARCLFKQRLFAAAATLCRDLIERNAERADFWLLEANAYLGMQEPLRAAANYEYLAARDMASAQALNTLGDIYVNEGLTDLAAGAYLRALSADTEAAPERYLRNGDVLAARGAPAEAARLSAAVRKKFGETLGTEARKRLLKLDARIAAAQGKAVAEQIALLEEIIALDPLDGEALILLGRHYASTDNVEKAAYMFECAARLEKFEAEACLRHAQCLVRHERYEEAAQLLKRSVEVRPREDVRRYLEQVERVAKAGR